MKAAEMITVGVPGRGDLSGCSVPDRRECVDGSRWARAVFDGLNVQVARLIEATTWTVGTHERDAAETSMRAEALIPKTRRGAVRSSEIVSPVSPCREMWCPHRRMDRIHSFGSTMYVFVRRIGGGVRGASVRMLCLCRDLTLVETVPHPLGRVDV
jgi:hypothetical protein